MYYAFTLDACALLVSIDITRLPSLGVQISCALARWLGWLEHRPAHQKVVCWIPGQGTHLGCGFDPWSGACGRQWADVLSHRCFSLSLSLPLSLKSVNISSGEDLK